MSRMKKMIYIGTVKISQLIEDTGLPKGQIGEEIGLTKGGFWHVTHVSGKMNTDTWKKFKKLYFKTLGKLPDVSDESTSNILSEVHLDDLLRELETRGYDYSIKLKKK